MTAKELFLGFDIRISGFSDDFIWVKKEYPTLQGIYVRDTDVWPSRFIEGGILSKDIQSNNYRDFSQTKTEMAVYAEYSQQYYLIHLWENLGSMLFRYYPDKLRDIVVGFSLFEISCTPPLLCHDLPIAETLAGKRFSNRSFAAHSVFFNITC